MCFVSILALWTIVILLGRIGKVPVMIATVPSDAIVVLNGQKVSNGHQWVTAGRYDINVSKDGFTEQKQTVIVDGQKKDMTIAISLVAKSDDAKRWAKENADKYKDNEKYGAIAARSEGEYLTATNPIIKNLPFTDPYYKIGYTTKDDNSITLTILTVSPRYRFYAVEKIRDWGYDPTDFLIEFKDFNNPLEQS